MRDDMFNWLLRKKQTTPLVPEVGGKVDHSPVEAEASVEAPATVAAVEVSPSANQEIAEPMIPAMDLAPGSTPAPEIEAPEAVVEAYEPEPAAADPEPAAPPTPEPTGSVDRLGQAPATTPSKSCRPRQPFTTGVSKPKPLLVLQGAAGEIDLKADLEVVEHSGRQARRGKLVAVRADGRRLLAKLGGAGRIRAYTLRRDGIYRLEGANDARAPVLELTGGL